MQIADHRERERRHPERDRRGLAQLRCRRRRHPLRHDRHHALHECLRGGQESHGRGHHPRRAARGAGDSASDGLARSSARQDRLSLSYGARRPSVRWPRQFAARRKGGRGCGARLSEEGHPHRGDRRAVLAGAIRHRNTGRANRGRGHGPGGHFPVAHHRTSGSSRAGKCHRDERESRPPVGAGGDLVPHGAARTARSRPRSTSARTTER